MQILLKFHSIYLLPFYTCTELQINGDTENNSVIIRKKHML